MLRMMISAALVAFAPLAMAQMTSEPTTSSKPAKASTPQDPLTVGAEIYRVILENERVRVLEARFKPGAKIAMHAHPDRVVVVTAAGKIAVTTAEGTQEFDAKVGDAFYVAAETHAAQNVGTTEFVCIVTELKGKYKAKGQASPKPTPVDVQQGKVDG